MIWEGKIIVYLYSVFVDGSGYECINFFVFQINNCFFECDSGKLIIFWFSLIQFNINGVLLVVKDIDFFFSRLVYFVVNVEMEIGVDNIFVVGKYFIGVVNDWCVLVKNMFVVQGFDDYFWINFVNIFYIDVNLRFIYVYCCLF